MLSPEEKRKYIKQIMLPEIGVTGQENIRNAKVAIIGCGGLGCPTLLYLASAGVGTIGIVDFDIIGITNLHRQILFGVNDVGKKKTHVAKDKLSIMHPEVSLAIHDVMLNETNAESILSQYDIVVDGCDNFLTRYIVNDCCSKLNKPLIYGSILGFEGQLAVFNLNGSKNLRDLFPEPPNDEDVPDCSVNGVLATIPGIIGTMLANECIKVILQKSNLENKLLIFNGLDMELSVLNY
ncbi:MAG: UBA/THIF-type binding protein [Bacteroidetes bacterium]|nr:UBA/THIF-type binding protein [Bacteroidota bacterium]